MQTGLLRSDQGTDGNLAAACPASSRSVDTEHQRGRATARGCGLRSQRSRFVDPAPMAAAAAIWRSIGVREQFGRQRDGHERSSRGQ